MMFTNGSNTSLLWHERSIDNPGGVNGRLFVGVHGTSAAQPFDEGNGHGHLLAVCNTFRCDRRTSYRGREDWENTFVSDVLNYDSCYVSCTAFNCTFGFHRTKIPHRPVFFFVFLSLGLK